MTPRQRVGIFIIVVFLGLLSGVPLLAQQASLSLSPSSGTWKIGSTFTVNIQLNTGGASTDGVDIYYLHYPQAILEVQDANTSVTGVQLSPGTLYPNTLSNTVTPTQGRIDFSQVTAGGQRFTGSGTLATITFKVLNSGSASLYFDFTPGSTVDCNVVSGANDILGSASGATFNLVANQPPFATASANPTLGIVPLTVSFTGSATDTDGTIASYAWNFGDGGTSSLQNPTRTYNIAGNYTAVLTATDNQGAIGSASVNVAVASPANQPPTATASANPTSGTVPLTVNFTGSATDTDGTIASYSWNFGDGGTSAQQNPSHTYSTAGNYTAVLRVTDNLSAIGSAPVNISVASAPSSQDCQVIGGSCKTSACTSYQSCSSLQGNCPSGQYCCQGTCSAASAPTPTPTPTPTPVPSGKPVISELAAQEITSNSVKITWKTDRLATAKVNYGKTSYFELGSVSGTGLATSYSLPITGLSPSTLYYFRVVSADSAGNTTQSENKYFRTLAPGQAPAPSPTTGISPQPQPVPTPLPSATSTFPIPPSGLSKAELIAWLRAKITELLALVGQLQLALQNLLAQQGLQGIPANFRFEKTLQYGARGIEITYLQVFLKSQGKIIYPEGLITGFFGNSTRAAVIRLQEKYAIEVLRPSGLYSGTGIVGSATRVKINQLLGR